MRHHHRRGRRRTCLDLAHRNPDLACPYCTTARDDQADIVGTAHRQHARTTAEDLDGFGWSS
ncbi:hypothetical protein [Dactylosporangium sp. NPDC051484]|uniref:hypothetical protein n=1 Tax=Dactylosporangium sp. NPDC051484 TaxID=3154942 RepID=UPI00344FA22D